MINHKDGMLTQYGVQAPYSLAATPPRTTTISPSSSPLSSEQGVVPGSQDSETSMLGDDLDSAQGKARAGDPGGPNGGSTASDNDSASGGFVNFYAAANFSMDEQILLSYLALRIAIILCVSSVFDQGRQGCSVHHMIRLLCS